MLKHNRPWSRSTRLSKGKKSCGKSKKCFCGKGFQCSVFSNLIEINTLNGILPATTLKIDKPHIREWKKYKKERAGKRLEREGETERERWEKGIFGRWIKY